MRGFHWIVFAVLLLCIASAGAKVVTIGNRQLFVAVRDSTGSYEIYDPTRRLILRSNIGAEIDHHWIKSTRYPIHSIAQSDFQDVLGHGRRIEVTFRGFRAKPDLSYILRVYDKLPFGDVEVHVYNQTSRVVTVEAIRNLEAFGTPLINLAGKETSERVLSDGFSEGDLQIYDFLNAPGNMHWAVGSQLIYGRDTNQSLFFGALTSDRFLTVLRLQTDKLRHRAISYTIDSTGTTEAHSRGAWFRQLPPGQRVQLSLPLAPGGSFSSERLMFSVGTDYHAQLESYGAAIRVLHHARVAGPGLMGWWSWPAYSTDISEATASRNAQWLGENLKQFGFDFVHIDEGYALYRGDYTTVDASKFPHGMESFGQNLTRHGLRLGIWAAPLEVDQGAWPYKAHKDWLVRNAQGQPLRIYSSRNKRPFFILDATHPDAQTYLRDTFRTMTRRWGVKYFKLDFMDFTAVEGYYHRPYTTALEAQKAALTAIRDGVGEEVLLDKDGSPVLNVVGIADEGRISGDTKHSFEGLRQNATGLLARYYMHRNFFVNDPDAFTLLRQTPAMQMDTTNSRRQALTLSEAEMSITLAAMSGGMFEIGDDLPTLASEPERVALITNPDIIELAKCSSAATPVDLLDYSSADLQPSVSFLREDKGEAFLAVFNWTERARSHIFQLTAFDLPQGRRYELYDVLNHDQLVLRDGKIVINQQPPHSVRLIKIVNRSSASALQPQQTIAVHQP